MEYEYDYIIRYLDWDIQSLEQLTIRETGMLLSARLADDARRLPNLMERLSKDGWELVSHDIFTIHSRMFLSYLLSRPKSG